MSNKENAVKRTLLDRERIAAQMRITNLVSIPDNGRDPDEVADGATFVRLFCLFEHYLKYHQDQPGLAEKVRQCGSLECLSPGFVPDNEENMRRQLVARSRLDEAELSLKVAEDGIRDFHRRLPWWHETYRITNERISARAGKTAPISSASSEPQPEPKIEKQQPLEQNDVQDDEDEDNPELRAIDDAIRALTDKATALDICTWIDSYNKVPCPYASQRSDRKWATFYRSTDREKKKPLDAKIGRRKGHYRKQKQQIQ